MRKSIIAAIAAVLVGLVIIGLAIQYSIENYIPPPLPQPISSTESITSVENHSSHRIINIIINSSEIFLSIVTLNYPALLKSRINCSVYINETHLVRTCTYYDIDWLFILFENGERLHRSEVSSELRKINITRTEIADLVNKYVITIVEANTERLGLKHYKRIIGNYTFEYKWVDISDVFKKSTPDFWDIQYNLRNGSIISYIISLAIFEYRTRPSGVVYRPASNETIQLLSSAADAFYCRFIKDVAGLECKVIVLYNMSTACRYPRNLLDPRTIPKIKCRAYYTPIVVIIGPNEMDLGETPTGPALGRNYNGETIYIRDVSGNFSIVDIFLHELGHSLNLPDVDPSYVCKTGSIEIPKLYCNTKNKTWLHSLFTTSIMRWANASYRSISLGDAAYLLHEIYMRDYYGDDEFYNRSLSMGIDPLYPKILLPITSDNKMPPGLREIIEAGVVTIYLPDPSKGGINEDLIKLMKTMYKIYMETQNKQ